MEILKKELVSHVIDILRVQLVLFVSSHQRERIEQVDLS